METQETRLLLKAEEVARRLSLGRSKVFQMIAQGELPVVRIGRSVRVPEKALEEWLERQIEEQRGGYHHLR